MFRPDPKPEKKPKKSLVRIKPLSTKRAQQNKEYMPLRNKFLEENPICQMQFDGCTHNSTQVHHDQGRIGKLLTDVSTFVACCFNCHRLHHDS